MFFKHVEVNHSFTLNYYSLILSILGCYTTTNPFKNKINKPPGARGY